VDLNRQVVAVEVAPTAASAAKEAAIAMSRAVFYAL